MPCVVVFYAPYAVDIICSVREGVTMTYMQFLKILGKNAQSLRKKKRLTQAEVAERLDISVKHYSAIERGAENLSIQVLFNLAQLYHVPPEVLLHDFTNDKGIHQALATFSDRVNSAVDDMCTELENAGLLDKMNDC